MSEDILKDSWAPKEPISKTIKDRVKKAGARAWANDNISEFINEGEKQKLALQVKRPVRSIENWFLSERQKKENPGNPNRDLKKPLAFLEKCEQSPGNPQHI